MQRVDDRRVLSGIVFINRNGLPWHDAPQEYGRHKALYDRWKRWSDTGVFARIMTGSEVETPDTKMISIDVTYHKAHCMALGLGSKKGARPSDCAHRRWYEHQAA